VSSFRHPGSEYASRDDWLFDTVLAILAVIFILAPYLVVIAFYGPVTSGRGLIAASAAGLALCVSVVLRRHYPLVFMALVAVFCAVHVVFVPIPFTMLVAIPAAVHAVARYVRYGVVWILCFWIPAAVAATLRWYYAATPSNELRLVALFGGAAFAGIILTAYTVGRRGHDLSVAREESAARELEVMREELALQAEGSQAATADERVQLAAELYDAFAATVSHIVVQADQAKALLGRHPQQAASTMDAVAGAGRGILNDLRQASGDSLPAYDGHDAHDYAPADYAPAPYGLPANPAPALAAPPAPAPVAAPFSGYGAEPAYEDYADAAYPDDEYGDYADADRDQADSGDGGYAPEPAVADYGADAIDDFAAAYPAPDYGHDFAAPADSVTPDEGHLPTPTLDDLPALVAAHGAALVVNGQAPEVDDMLSTTAYRIIEEALDNVDKHAGPGANPTVYLDWGDADVELSVTNDPTGFQPDPATRPGEGLDTMAERAEAINGVLETGPTEAGGFHVWASLPYNWQGDAADAAAFGAAPAAAWDGAAAEYEAEPADDAAWDDTANATWDEDQGQWVTPDAGWAGQEATWSEGQGAGWADDRSAYPPTPATGYSPRLTTSYDDAPTWAGQPYAAAPSARPPADRPTYLPPAYAPADQAGYDRTGYDQARYDQAGYEAGYDQTDQGASAWPAAAPDGWTGQEWPQEQWPEEPAAYADDQWADETAWAQDQWPEDQWADEPWSGPDQAWPAPAYAPEPAYVPAPAPAYAPAAPAYGAPRRPPARRPAPTAPRR
jgi:signal transduction histidine kinase